MPITDRLAPALVDRYRVERELGQGGMATVFLARDLRHDRDVAIKVLHPDLGAALGGERFLSEIRTTARLQHPHILPLLDSGEAAGVLYYVMPLVTGETLRQRLDRERQLPVADALRIVREVADALQHAHLNGVVHRDIKPENILLQGGHALVADFGIALAVQTAGGQRMTQTGLSLGTPQYMSPEQAMGERTIDARSDVYALGAVTYEMLVGEAPFTGPTVQAIVARLLAEQPRAISAQRPAVPAHVEAAVLQALEKLPADRWESVAAFAQALGDPSISSAFARTGTTPRHERSVSRRAVLGLSALVALLGGLAAWGWLRPGVGGGGSDASAVWLAIDPPLASFGDYPGPAMSPDGKHVAFFATNAVGRQQLYVRDLNSAVAKPIQGSDRPEVDVSQQPFWSPDSKSLAYFGGGALYRVDLDGRPPLKLADAPNPRGGTWNRDGVIVFVPGTSGMQRLDASGGTMQPIGDPKAPANAIDRWPFFLPDGKHFLFMRRNAGKPPAVMVGSLDGEEVKLVLEVASRAEFADGQLYFVREGALFAQPFDVSTLALSGSATRVADEVGVNGADSRNSAFSAGGGHVVTWSGLETRLTQISVLGPDGRVIRKVGPPGVTANMALDPRARRLALERTDNKSAAHAVWFLDLVSSQLSIFASFSEGAGTPQWLPDGSAVLYSTFTGRTVVRKNVVTGDTLSFPSPFAWIGGITPDGTRALIQTTGAGTGLDIMVLPLDPGRAPTPYLNSKANEEGVAISPDGAWLAFTSDESGQSEVYVQSFPVPGARQIVSSGGGGHAQWSADGKRLYYLTDDHMLMAADVVRSGASLTLTSRALFRVNVLNGLSGARKPYVPLADGTFVVNLVADSVPPQRMRIGLNWAGR
jgi:eukaryotic-like serine/threonine-protein kinase